MSTTTATITPKKTRLGVRKIDSAEDVKRLLAKLIRARLADNGSLTDAMLRSITQALSVFLKAAEQGSIEDRLNEIEGKLNEYEGSRL
ncbi:MAG: hypothetical protein JZU49_00340 [Sulfuricurvum sp.]|nr:hypothetical protein [Sulfuricurvum sp.]